MSKDMTALTLFGFGGLQDPATKQVSELYQFANTVDSKTGQITGQRLKEIKRKEFAAKVGLTTGKADRDELDAAILERRDVTYRQIMGWLASKGDFMTHMRSAFRYDKSGALVLSLTLRQADRGKVISPEAIAKAYGVSVDEVKAWLRAKVPMGSPVHDVEQVPPAALPAPGATSDAPALDSSKADTAAAESAAVPELTQQEKDELELALLAAEESAAVPEPTQQEKDDLEPALLAAEESAKAAQV